MFRLSSGFWKKLGRVGGFYFLFFIFDSIQTLSFYRLSGVFLSINHLPNNGGFPLTIFSPSWENFSSMKQKKRKKCWGGGFQTGAGGDDNLTIFFIWPKSISMKLYRKLLQKIRSELTKNEQNR